MSSDGKHFLVHTDGAAKGNPGPAGIGVVLYKGDSSSEPVAVIGEYIGETTNNVAEYKAMIRGLSEALLRGAETVEVRTDSELMARQIEGRYKVGAPQIVPLYEEARRLLGKFARARVTHVRREQNSLADKMANQGVAERGRGGSAPAPRPAATPSPAPAPAPVPKPTPKIEAWPFKHTHSHPVGEEVWAWDVERLWERAKPLPVKTLPLEEVGKGVLDEDCWFGDTPATIRRVAEHAKRIYEADLSQPILLAADGRLMDGGHRIARAWLEGKTEIRAVRFQVTPDPDIRRPRG